MKLGMRSIFAGLAALLMALPAMAVRELQGQAPSGAYYSIAVPDGWKAGDGLVMYQHGLNFAADDDPGLGPLRDIALQQGFAIAGSGFTSRGWALLRAVDENKELLQIFRRDVGDPGELIPFGGSMGGLVALKMAEDTSLNPLIKGVLALCPPVAASRAWDSGLDVRLAYDTVCADVNNGRLKTGAEPYPWAYNLNDIPDDLDNLELDPDVRSALLSVTVCTGITLPQSIRTNGMRERLARLQRITGIQDEKFLLTNIAYSTFVLSDVLRAADKMDGRNPFGNIGAMYADADLDSRIRRVTPQPAARVEFNWQSDYRGDIGDIKVLSVHTSGDELVIPQHQYVLRQLTPANQLVSAVVRETAPSHCGFSEREGLVAWEALKRWKDGGAKPTVAQLQQGCLSVSGDGECRFDDTYVPTSFDARVPPRAAPLTVDGRFNGSWFDPSRSGEGIALEVLPGGRAIVYFFTFSPAGTPQRQAWMIGDGKVVPGGIAFDTAYYRPSNADGTPAANATTPWGRFWIGFSDCNNGELRWEGPQGWGRKTVPLSRLTALKGLGCGSSGTVPAQASGSWYDPAHAGSGFHIEQFDGNRALVMYYGAPGSSDFVGWASGVVEGDLAAGTTVSLASVTGPVFGDNYDPAAVVNQPGALSLTLKLGCNSGEATLTKAGGPAVPLALARLTTAANTAPCP
ncbi:hypothetical protein DFR29_102344 [Tahibacter aquaticus]|uniref:Serine aminopeptidase S33 family n=2 Tax=Tahibacter aquaticus TaxID=520092 RepID=A0A4R6Z7I1_9GAMM|nr:hypothetical protein DFR29_102344 [Tahibacter aquaticus]